MQQLLSYINDHYSLTIEAQQALQDGFEQIRVAKNDYLLKEGQRCRNLYFIETGALRGYYTLEEKEVTHWFGFENDFVTSFHSFITGDVAVENIQLLEGATLWRISKEKLFCLFDDFHEIERLVRIIYEKYYLRLEDRYVNAQFKTASERYEDLLLQSPHIIERVSLGHIASYLGISQETLSRIRGKL